jgi:hypothetical protein
MRFYLIYFPLPFIQKDHTPNEIKVIGYSLRVQTELYLF